MSTWVRAARVAARRSARPPAGARAAALPVGVLAVGAAVLVSCAASSYGPVGAPAAQPSAVPTAVPPTPSGSPAPAPRSATAQDRGTRPVLTSAAAPAVAVPVSAVRTAGDGELHVVPGVSPPAGSGPVRRYVVEVEGDIGVDPQAFAAAVERTLAEPRSWTSGGRVGLQRVDSGEVDFRLVLASPSLTDRLCAPLRTAGRFSCHQGDRAVINAMRWLSGASAYEGRLADYRHYVVNHEVGHALGHGHVGCPGAGQRAPVMMQQTKGVARCTAQPWPYPSG